MESIFTLYESRHSGWQINLCDATKAEQIINDPDNIKVFVCVTNDNIDTNLEVDIANELDLVPYDLNYVR